MYTDLKPENILINDMEDGSLNIKLADFDLIGVGYTIGYKPLET